MSSIYIHPFMRLWGIVFTLRMVLLRWLPVVVVCRIPRQQYNHCASCLYAVTYLGHLYNSQVHHNDSTALIDASYNVLILIIAAVAILKLNGCCNCVMMILCTIFCLKQKSFLHKYIKFIIKCVWRLYSLFWHFPELILSIKQQLENCIQILY